MSEIENMRRYIEQTKVPKDTEDTYCLRLGELREIGIYAKSDPFHALILLFGYGLAKGYRAAKAEGRRRYEW